MNKLTALIINGKSVIIDDRLASFTIHQKNSGSVDYYGIDKSGSQIFIQFKGGSPAAYIYKGISPELITAAETAESIGKFVTNNLAHKCEMDKFHNYLVQVNTVQK